MRRFQCGRGRTRLSESFHPTKIELPYLHCLSMRFTGLEPCTFCRFTTSIKLAPLVQTQCALTRQRVGFSHEVVNARVQTFDRAENVLREFNCSVPNPIPVSLPS